MKLWGGRFQETTDAVAHQFTRSFPFDRRLYRYDIQGSIAHARMLGQCGIVTPEESEAITQGLQSILQDIDAGALPLEGEDEDIHTFVERVLTERIGIAAGKLHTARSRNDQVVLDMRMYVRDQITQVSGKIAALQTVLVNHAEKHVETILPGYTHLQHAQPVSLAHHLLAYFWMLQRDRERMKEAHKRVNILPLGAAALAGTSFPIDRELVARELEFDAVSRNSMDSVSDRDFILEFLFIVSLLMTHLSRLCEELILWSTAEFGFVEFDERFCTGSSIMPQKKNPDVVELIRGKAGRVYGDLVALLTVMQGLPLAYHSDMQEDKEALFDAGDTVGLVLTVLPEAMATLTFNVQRMRQAAGLRYAVATDLADYLAKRDVPFREAHGVVGRIVRYAIEAGKDICQLTVEEMQQFDSRIESDVLSILTLEASIASRQSMGGTAPERVREQIDQARAALREVS